MAIRLITVVLLACGLIGGCTSTPRSQAPRPTARPAPVVVASFNFPESALLAEIYAQAVAHAGIPVRRELDLGPRELVQPALRQGLVDVVPEYLGSALAAAQPGVDLTHGTRADELGALRRAVVPMRLTVLTPSAAQDRNAFAVTAATASRLHLRTLSDLARVGRRLVLGGPAECPHRPLCLGGLQRVYGMRFRRFEPFDDERLRSTALRQGVIDVELTFSTNPQLADGSLVALRDDRRLQPDESVVPVVGHHALARYGTRLVRALDAVSARLDSRALVLLNWRVAAGHTLADEASDWRRRHGLAG